MAASFLFSQFMGGLTTAMFLFLIASGLSLVFGVMRVINFAHGSFYMIGAYLAWQAMQWLHPVAGAFWLATLFAASGVAVLGAVVERLFFRSLYGREELYQLLFTYALVLILGDAAKFIWGTGQLSVSHPAGARRQRADLRNHAATLQPVHHCGRPGDRVRRLAGVERAPARAAWCAPRHIDREMLAALGANVGSLYTGMFIVSSFLAGLSGALVTPIQSIVPGMDVEIIVQAFIVVVIGGLGSFWGTFWGSVIYGQVLSFGILIFPGFSLFSVFALMAVILIVRPWGLFGRPLR